MGRRAFDPFRSLSFEIILLRCDDVVGNGVGLLDCLTTGMLDALEHLKHLVEKMCFRQKHPVGMSGFGPKPLQPLEILDQLGTDSAKEAYQYRAPVGDCVDFTATSYSNVL